MPISSPYSASKIRRGRASDNIPIRTNLAAWYRYHVGITNVGGFCSSWYDNSGNQRPLLQASASARPTINSDGSLSFDGSNDFMQATFTLIQPMTVYLAFMPLSDTNNDVLFDGVTGTTTLSQDTNASTYDINAGSALAYSGTILANTKAVIAVVFNGTAARVQAGNGAASITSSGDAGANNAGGITLGASQAPGSFANIRVYELAVFSVAHDATTRLRMLRYMARVAQVGGV